MRKLLAGVVLMLAALTPAFAQGFIPAQAPAWVYADNYGHWAIQGQNTNTYSFTPSSICQITQLDFKTRTTFFAFSSAVAEAPVFIQDVNSAESEVVTPGSAATQTQQTCSVNISPANSHTTFTLQSGTGGLQEAINTLGQSSYLYTIVLSPEWYKLISGISNGNATLTAAVTPAGVIGAATCTSKTQLVDVTSNPWAYYSCDPATSKFVISTPASKAPTIAASTGAGTSPTIALVAGSSASSGTVTLTTGTTPGASDAIFTLTFPTAASGGYAYAPACTITSVGAEAYTTGVVTSSAGSGTPTATLTASAAALTASTAGYAWTYTCH